MKKKVKKKKVSASLNARYEARKGDREKARKKALKKATIRKLTHGQVLEIAISDIHPSPENLCLYRPIKKSDPDNLALVESIKKHGVKEALVLTEDRWILSGHRRYFCAGWAGEKALPIRIEPFSREEDEEKFLTVLREYNRQRVKTYDEKLREEIVSASANPDETYDSLIEARKEASQVDSPPMEIIGKKKRCKISNAKIPMLNSVIDILNKLNSIWPLSDRKVHYQLLNDPPLKHASKPGSIYRNEEKSYKAATDILTRGRLEKYIPFEAIGDETRPIITWGVSKDPATFIRSELDGFMKGYFRDLMQSQPNHIEILCEKNTLLSVVKPIALEYCIPVMSGRGYSSLTPRWKMATRFRNSGKRKLVLLILSDFDPDGEEIAQSFARSMRDDFRIKNIHAIKVALTQAQTIEYNLPNGMPAKKLSPNYPKFFEKYGDITFELEALETEDLQDMLREAIDGVIDTKAFNHELAQEKKDAAFIIGTRKTMLSAFGDVTLLNGKASKNGRATQKKKKKKK